MSYQQAILQGFTKNAALSNDEMVQKFKGLFSASPFQDPETRNARWFESEVHKNRYADIIPFEASRVKILPLTRGGSDYINASHLIVPYRNKTYRYIAAQGPLPNTAVDFWHLILQKSLPIVVMITKLSENGREKCYQYWPELGEKKEFDYIVVETTSEKEFASHIVREFSVYDSASPMMKHKVTHFHYIDWPDGDVPKNARAFLSFWREVGELTRKLGDMQPLVVHCSAGCGRTGVYIVLDACIRVLDAHQQANLPYKEADGDIVVKTIELLRKSRVAFVQTPEQLRFCYKVLAAYLEHRKFLTL